MVIGATYIDCINPIHSKLVSTNTISDNILRKEMVFVIHRIYLKTLVEKLSINIF